MNDITKNRDIAPTVFETPRTLANKNQIKKSPSRLYFLVLVVLIVLVIALTAMLIIVQTGEKNNTERYQDRWQAVFLENGQVYFGQIIAEKENELVLKNIYYYPENFLNYLQGGEERQLSDLSIIKLGTELHGPEDQMIINRSFVMFVENLKENSKILQTIKKYQEKMLSK